MEAVSAIGFYSCHVRGSFQAILASRLGGKTRHVGPLNIFTEDGINLVNLDEVFVQMFNPTKIWQWYSICGPLVHLRYQMVSSAESVV